MQSSFYKTTYSEHTKCTVIPAPRILWYHVVGWMMHDAATTSSLRRELDGARMTSVEVVPVTTAAERAPVLELLTGEEQTLLVCRSAHRVI